MNEIQLRRLRRFGFALLGLALLLLLWSAMVASPNNDRTNPTVVNRIKSLTSCSALQHEFDVAEANGNISYMRIADGRMRAIGCYG